MGDLPTFSFLIVNYRSAQYLTDWFTSLSHTGLSSEEYEVIVVNNDSEDLPALQALQKRYTFKLIEAGKNLGFGAGHNRGAQEAQGIILGLCNPDSRFLPGNWRAVAEQFEANPTLAILTPRLVTEQGETQAWSVGAPVTLWDLVTNNFGFPRSRKLWESRTPLDVAWVSGACMFVRRSVFEQLQGFDEQFFMYFEDIDLCRRAIDSGKKVIYFPEFKVLHLGGKSFSSLYQQKKEYYVSQDKYFRKQRPKWEGQMVKTLRRVFH